MLASTRIACEHAAMAIDTSELQARLVSISDELAEMALTVLRDAIEHGETTRPAAERRLTRARAAIDKAVHLLDEQPAS